MTTASAGLASAGIGQARGAAVPAGEWKAGLAKISMTPRGSLWMAGFGDRKRPSEGVGLELYARALALEDSTGKRAAVVSTDMLGFPAVVSKVISDRVREQYGISRDRLLLNSSHTHCGPVIEHIASCMYNLTSQQAADVRAYTQELEDKVVRVIGEALGHLEPARLSYGVTNASFGVNRRQDEGRKWGPNYAGPADHDVPVMRVNNAAGKPARNCFRLGCHPSTLPPSYCKFHSDYAGVTAKWLEDHHPGAVSMFVQGAGGDVKPLPCDTLALAEAYGATLGATVEHEFADLPMVALGGPLRSDFEILSLALSPPPTREQLEERAKTGPPTQRRNGACAEHPRPGWAPPADYPYPVQAWQFGHDLTLVALGGELLSDYGLRLKREFSDRRLWVAGYSNDVMAYIPPVRVLREGGYQGGGAMMVYGQAGPWASSIEEAIVAKVQEVVGRVQG